MKSLLPFLDQTFIGISLGQFAAAFGSLILALIAKKILGHVGSNLNRLVHKNNVKSE